MEGIGINRVTKNMNMALSESVVDTAIRVTDSEAVNMSRYLLQNDGLFIGSSTAVNCVAALRVAKLLGPVNYFVLF